MFIYIEGNKYIILASKIIHTVKLIELYKLDNLA